MKHTVSIPPEIKKIATLLKNAGFSCYIAGGWCRDTLLGLPASDIDLFTDAEPEIVKKHLKVVGEVGKKYGTCIVKEGRKSFEITTFRKDIGSINYRKPAEVTFTKSLEEDAQRRDFTCNAIYFDILEKSFIDPTGGIHDIQNGIIRFVGDPLHRLEEDILRLLRYVRIKYKYSFLDADIDYKKIFLQTAHLLENLPIERVQEEFEKILLLKKNTQALQELKDIGFFMMFLREVEKLSDTPGGAPWHLEGNVWVHTLMTIQEMNFLIFGEGNTLKIGKRASLDLIWTMLLHDIGKADTVSYGPNGDIHYYGHEELSARYFKDITKRWKFATSSVKKIHWLIENHLRVAHTLKMSPVKRHRFMMERYFSDLLYVYEADKKGRLPVSYQGVQDTKKYFVSFQRALEKIKFFTGNDVMEKFPEIEGKKIGEILEQWNNEILGNLEVTLN